MVEVTMDKMHKAYFNPFHYARAGKPVNLKDVKELTQEDAQAIIDKFNKRWRILEPFIKDIRNETMMASDNVISSFDLEARVNRIMRNTDKTKTEALAQAHAELLQEQAHEAGVVNYLREDDV